MRDCPTISARGKKSKQDPPSYPGNDAPRKNNFYALRARGSRPDEDENVGK